MQIDNGSRRRLVIPGVFEGMAGVAGSFVSFVPNRSLNPPGEARGGTLDGVPVFVAPVKDEASAMWTSRFEVVE